MILFFNLKEKPMNVLTRYWKTILASIPFVMFVGAEVVEALEEADADAVITSADWRNILVSLVTAVLVYAKANTPPDGEPRDPEMSEVRPDAGAANVPGALYVLLVVLAILAILWFFGVRFGVDA